MSENTSRTPIKWGIFGTVIFFGILTAWSGFYTVPEGHVAVVKKWSEAVRQENPGLRFKLPWIESTEVFEVRERKNVERMAAATANQLPATADVSINWTVNREAAMDLFIRYGGLDQFEDRVLDPRMRSAAKAAISRFRADQIIRERLSVVAEIQKEILEAMVGLPISVNTTQLEDVSLPPTYMESILAKEKAREDAEREKHTLTQQKLIAQQKVQTAEAERDALKARADGRAYEKRTLADAESYRVKTEYTGRSEGVKLLRAQLTPEYIDYLRAQSWNGVLPQTMLGSDSNVLLGLSGGTK